MHLIGRGVKYVCIGVLFVCIFAISLTFYLCSNRTCLKWPDPPVRRFRANRKLLIPPPRATPNITVGKSDFDIRGSDVIVFLHVQNTGGSVFARHIVEDLDLERPCKCRRNRRLCRCYRPDGWGSSWLFSRYTTGWKCGVHPDWSQLTTCVDRAMDEEEGKPVKRRYFFVTVLRDPVKRFLSEFLHVRRLGQGTGAWSSSPRWCTIESSSCSFGSNLTLDDFVGCEHNGAINRQTRMLSDQGLVGCYNSSSLSREDRDMILLTSAKNNLHQMSFFGLSEFPKVSQYVFEATFGLTFRRAGSGRSAPLSRKRRKELFREIRTRDLDKVRQLNHLDEELYQYAKELLFLRFERLKREDPSSFEDSLARSSKAEDWADREDNNLMD